jgi:hypothetical protein
LPSFVSIDSSGDYYPNFFHNGRRRRKWWKCGEIWGTKKARKFIQGAL